MNMEQIENVVLNALRLAARTFEANARNAFYPKQLREQFIVQARDSLNAAELIEVKQVEMHEKQLSSFAPRCPSPREIVGASHSAADSPAVAGNDGGISFADIIVHEVRFYECSHGFSHPIGQPCNGECTP